MFTKEECILKWILGFLNVIFVMRQSFFSPFFISVKNICWKWRWKSLKNMITYRTCICNTYSTHRYIWDHLSIFLLVQKSLPEPPGTLEDDAKFVLTSGSVPVLKSSWFIPSFLLEKEWQTFGTKSLIDLILPPGYPLSDNNWTGGLKWALILVFSSSSSSTFLVLIFCFLSGKNSCLYIHGWWILFLWESSLEKETDGSVRKERTKPLANHFPEPTELVTPLYLGASLWWDPPQVC